MFWLCRCDCGREVATRADQLKLRRSCGCLDGEQHGMAHTKEWRAWKHMKQRCIDPTHKSFPLYGGRGIGVCAAWMRFSEFFRDMGPAPSAKHSIERVDNDRGYEPGNCRWATQAEQVRNTRRCKWIEYRGERLLRADLARRLGVNWKTMNYRLRRWSLERACTEPKRQ